MFHKIKRVKKQSINEPSPIKQQTQLIHEYLSLDGSALALQLLLLSDVSSAVIELELLGTFLLFELLASRDP